MFGAVVWFRSHAVPSTLSACYTISLIFTLHVNMHMQSIVCFYAKIKIKSEAGNFNHDCYLQLVLFVKVPCS
jgi:hypothetical protein